MADKKKRKHTFLNISFGSEANNSPPKDKPDTLTLQPALRQLGTTRCPICKRETAVFLTRTNRPFLNCSFCSARVFYNGRESMRLLKKQMEPVEE